MNCPPLARILPVVSALAFFASVHAAASQHERTPDERTASVQRARQFADAAPADRWDNMFNGTNLDSWTPVAVSPTTFTAGFDDSTTPPTAVIKCTGHPTGIMRTDRMYRNFVFEMDFSHRDPKSNAGLFIWSDAICSRGVPFSRSIEVQVMDGTESRMADGRLRYTSQGDIFSIHGAKMTPDRPHPEGWARCLPSEDRMKPAPEWNHYRVICVDGIIKLEINGKEVSGGYNCSPREGYICLESEGGAIWFKNLRVLTLPSTRNMLPTPSLRADPELAQFRAIFDGTLDNFTVPPESVGHWKPEDWTLVFDGQGGDIWSKESFGDCELIADWRWAGPPQGQMVRPLIGPDGNTLKNADGSEKTETIDEYDSGIFLRGNSKSQVNLWNWNCGSGEVWGYRTDPNLAPDARAACTPKAKADAPIGQWNRFRIRMQGEVLNVWLNDQHVIVDATLAGVPSTGPIGLQKHGSAVDWGNVMVRRLE
ncbi:MAG: DUF1080 domain-containing protein [Planctomycetota bacterium]|nr:DUF1080 domain-containing protein [Planctomycetota bacterium]